MGFDSSKVICERGDGGGGDGGGVVMGDRWRMRSGYRWWGRSGDSW